MPVFAFPRHKPQPSRRTQVLAVAKLPPAPQVCHFSGTGLCSCHTSLLRVGTTAGSAVRAPVALALLPQRWVAHGRASTGRAPQPEQGALARRRVSTFPRRHLGLSGSGGAGCGPAREGSHGPSPASTQPYATETPLSQGPAPRPPQPWPGSAPAGTRLSPGACLWLGAALRRPRSPRPRPAAPAAAGRARSGSGNTPPLLRPRPARPLPAPRGPVPPGPLPPTHRDRRLGTGGWGREQVAAPGARPGKRRGFAP